MIWIKFGNITMTHQRFGRPIAVWSQWKFKLMQIFCAYFCTKLLWMVWSKCQSLYLIPLLRRNEWVVIIKDAHWSHQLWTCFWLVDGSDILYLLQITAVIVLVPSQCLLSLQTAQCLEEKKKKTRLTVDRDKPVDLTSPSSSPFESNPKGKRVFGIWTVTKFLWEMRPWEFSDSPESKKRQPHLG